ncbi:MAG: hypothetical protein HYR66_07685 [Sphingobacteriales bacterium]|nr:hypothetical protein [Sphingobacteriales bacterium]MBI3719574.1 hypothetical protein [Sphingobacteriales bacterium]
MLDEVYTMDWSGLNAETMRKSLNEKLEEVFLHSKNRQFVQNTELENATKECCADDSDEPEEIL